MNIKEFINTYKPKEHKRSRKCTIQDLIPFEKDIILLKKEKYSINQILHFLSLQEELEINKPKNSNQYYINKECKEYINNLAIN
jgi:hypothetical protein